VVDSHFFTFRAALLVPRFANQHDVFGPLMDRKRDRKFGSVKSQKCIRVLDQSRLEPNLEAAGSLASGGFPLDRAGTSNHSIISKPKASEAGGPADFIRRMRVKWIQSCVQDAAKYEQTEGAQNPLSDGYLDILDAHRQKLSVTVDTGTIAAQAFLRVGFRKSQDMRSAP
jgi:hypothetical protein